MKLADLPVRAVEKGQITFRNDKGRACTPKAAGLVVPEKARARVSDPQTSHEAAQSITAVLPRLEAIVLGALKQHRGGMTSEEIADHLGMDRVTVSPRLKPLERKELIARTGEKRVGRSGRKGEVWKAA